MAIPFILVTGCIVIASAYSFHGKADESFLSSDPAEVQKSRLFSGAAGTITARIKAENPDAFAEADALEDADAKAAATTSLLADFVSKMSQEERKLAATLVKPNAGQLAQSLAPLLGEQTANLVFGLGAFGMGFSTIIILMMINGFAIAELLGIPGKHAREAGWCTGCRRRWSPVALDLGGTIKDLADHHGVHVRCDPAADRLHRLLRTHEQS